MTWGLGYTTYVSHNLLRRVAPCNPLVKMAEATKNMKLNKGKFCAGEFGDPVGKLGLCLMHSSPAQKKGSYDYHIVT